MIEHPSFYSAVNERGTRFASGMERDRSELSRPSSTKNFSNLSPEILAEWIASFLFLGCQMFQTRPQSSPVYLLRLVARTDKEFSRGICDKCRKFPKVRKCSKINVPLFPNIPQQFPCSLKGI